MQKQEIVLNEKQKENMNEFSEISFDLGDIEKYLNKNENHDDHEQQMD